MSLAFQYAGANVVTFLAVERVGGPALGEGREAQPLTPQWELGLDSVASFAGLL